MQRIISGLTREKDGQHIPVILFSKGCNLHLAAQANSGCDAIGVDWTISLDEARKMTGGSVALQGNLDPAALLSDEVGLRRAVAEVLGSYGNGSGHVFNLGHGITPNVAPEHLGLVISLVHELSPAYHQ
jgi:uroporphyrinogen decarboxylase